MNVIDLPETYDGLKKLSNIQQNELWQKYFNKKYKAQNNKFNNQSRSLWYYIQCENMKLKIEPKYLTKLNKYSNNPDVCKSKVNKNKYNLQDGSEIYKIFRGIEFKITVVNSSDFIFKDKHYKTLSAIAKEICGSKVSGYNFFGFDNKNLKKNIII